MEFFLDGSPHPYRIVAPESIRTPRLLVFEDRVERNIETMRRLLASLDPPLGFDALCPHVKTHKSIRMTRRLMSAGISFFKSTLNELQMLIDAGAERIFIAYPLLPADVERVADLIESRPDLDIYVQAGHRKHIEFLQRRRVNWQVLIDVNIGMDRTGLAPQKAYSFYQEMRCCRNIEFSGLHAYDGHIHQRLEAERFVQAKQAMHLVVDLVQRFAAAGAAPPITILAGTPSFWPDAQLLKSLDLPTRVYFSPGTWIYFDSLTNELWPGQFEIAAVLLTQVIDLPAPNRATLNIGYKRWAVDQGPLEQFSVPEMKACSWSEEHTVVSLPENASIDVGDYILAAPRHVCSTINLWENYILVDAEGLPMGEYPIDGRNQ